jgi:hypothetical protein
MAVASNALATFAEAKAMFGYDDTEQTKVESLINIASARMELYTGRALKARDSTLYLDGTGTNALIVPEWPINSVAHLYVDSSRVYGSGTEIATASFSIMTEEGIIVLSGAIFSYSGARRAVKLEANLGFATTHLRYPALNGACLEFVEWMKSRVAPGTVGKRGEYSIDRVSVSYETEMPINVRAVLDELRKVA